MHPTNPGFRFRPVSARPRLSPILPLLAAFCTLALSCGLACTGANAPEVDSDSAKPDAGEVLTQGAAIVGGVPDEGHAAVGALVSDRALCTGTLVAPRVVLTAAHCVDSDPPEFFLLGASIDAPSAAYRVIGVLAHPDYGLHHQKGSAVAWHDIGVAFLERAPDVAPMAWRGDALDGAAGEAVTFVGFGTRTPGGTDHGRKYRFDTVIDQVWDQGFWNSTDPDAPHNTCHGDSGGPALVSNGGRIEVAGVVSSGDAGCVENGWNTRVDANAAFVAKVLASQGIGEPGCGDGACVDDEDLASCPTDCVPCPRIGYEGCCEGSSVVWCQDGEVASLDCGGSGPCGWNDEAGLYDCGTDGGESPDPSRPYDCRL